MVMRETLAERVVPRRGGDPIWSDGVDAGGDDERVGAFAGGGTCLASRFGGSTWLDSGSDAHPATAEKAAT